jgi:penicillin G amidase
MANPDLVDRFPASAAKPTPRTRKRRWLRIVAWTVCGLALLLLAGAGWGVLRLRSAARAALPQLDGQAHLAGLSAPVTVQRDAHGVPHITAATEDDLFVAQGYVTAQDRLWQMDILRRNANGELAEILGSALLPHDRMQRVLKMRDTAQRIYASLPAADRTRLDDYARGVNLFIEQHPDSLPPEFTMLMYRPQPWAGADSLSLDLMMVQTLDMHWEAKLARERIAADLKNAKLESDLYPVGSWRDRPPTGIQVDMSQPQPAPPSGDDDDDDDRTQAGTRKLAPGTEATPIANTDAFGRKLSAGREDLPSLRSLLGLQRCAECSPGSNEWVISGKHTASGHPLLSNDMHLDLSVPNIWYMADLRAPGFHAAGVTLPGIPFVVAGHNEHVAWGYTALYADVQDLYVEKLDGKGNYMSADGSWKPLGVDHETIHVRGGKDEALDVESTAHGPLLNPIFTGEKRPIALAWTIYDTPAGPLPIYVMNAASNWSEFSAALGEWPWPTLNVVYSDDQGHIAYHAVGQVPLRPGGLAGVPIQDGRHEWKGYIPFDDLPSAVDPPSGFLATANSRVTTEKTPYPLTLEWADPYRTERIYKELQGRDQLTPKDLLTLETDIYSEVDQELAHRFAYAIDHTAGVDDRLRKSADLMRSWDGKLTVDSAAASLVTQARKAFRRIVLESKLGRDADDYSWSESNFAEEEIIMRANALWLPKDYRNWDALLTDAVRKGMESGKAPADVSQWRYGSWHVIDLEHPLAAFLPLLGRIVGTGELPLSGDTLTVKQSNRTFGPSQRFTMDWSNIDGSTENIVLGESGNPLSPYFRDQWNDWYGGTTFAFPFSPAAVAAQTQHTLRLEP